MARQTADHALPQALAAQRRVRWHSAATAFALPRLELEHLVPHGRRAVLVATHPGDEVLGCGGLLQQLSGNRDLMIISLTNGCHRRGARRMDDARLAVIRPQESVEALRRLGLDLSRLKWIRGGLPEGALVASEARIGELLLRYVREDDVLIAPWRDDEHPDHAAAGRSAARVSMIRGAGLIEVPLWTQAPLQCWRHNDAGLLPLDLFDLARKRHALQAFASLIHGNPRSGISPLFDPQHRARLLQPGELLIHSQA